MTAEGRNVGGSHLESVLLGAFVVTIVVGVLGVGIELASALDGGPIDWTRVFLEILGPVGAGTGVYYLRTDE